MVLEDGVSDLWMKLELSATHSMEVVSVSVVVWFKSGESKVCPGHEQRELVTDVETGMWGLIQLGG